MVAVVEVAITRDVALSIAQCELTFVDRVVIDFERAALQHAAYCERLEALGIEVIRLRPDEQCPDCCFVEDTAVVLDEVAVLTNMGSPARRAESTAMGVELGRHCGGSRRLQCLEAPATLDGGDVLVMGRQIFVGQTTRTNLAGIEGLRRFTVPWGYEVVPLSVSGCLHLKSAVSAVDDETLLANSGWVDLSGLSRRFRIVDVDFREPGAANVLSVRGEVWAHPGFPRTFERLQTLGHEVVPLDISEFVKAEGALTCKSVLFRRQT